MQKLTDISISFTSLISGASCYAPKSEASCETLLATSLNNLISGTEGATEQDQVIIEGNTESHQGSCSQPPISNQKFILEGRKAGISRVNAGKEGHCKSDQLIQIKCV